MWGWLQEYHLHWHDTSQIIIDFFFVIVFICIWNQFKGHWLLTDASNFVIFMSLKFKDKIDFAPFDNLMEETTYVLFEL